MFLCLIKTLKALIVYRKEQREMEGQIMKPTGTGAWELGMCDVNWILVGIMTTQHAAYLNRSGRYWRMCVDVGTRDLGSPGSGFLPAKKTIEMQRKTDIQLVFLW